MAQSESLPDAARQALEGWPLYDNAIVRHGFVPYMRDYELIVEAAAATPDATRSYLEGRYQYLFTHCVAATVTTSLGDEAWRTSWSDSFIDYKVWEATGSPNGYVWGVEYMDAFPGATQVLASDIASEWSKRLGQPMREVLIETNAHTLRLVFHQLHVYKIAQGDPETGVLTAIEPQDILAAT